MSNGDARLSKFAVTMTVTFPIYAANIGDAVARATGDLPHGTRVDFIKTHQWRDAHHNGNGNGHSESPVDSAHDTALAVTRSNRRWSKVETDLLVKAHKNHITNGSIANQLHRTSAAIATRLSGLYKNGEL